MANGKQVKCECGHDAHHSGYQTEKIGCKTSGCKCIRSSEEVEREFGAGRRK